MSALHPAIFLAILVAALSLFGVGCGGGGGGGGAQNTNPTAATSSELETQEDTLLVIDLLGFVIDPDDDPLTAEVIEGPQNGNVTEPDDQGTVTYQPSLDFNGGDSFRYAAHDGRGGRAEGTISITVIPVNDPPTASDDRASTTPGDSVEILVLDNDTDREMDALEIVAIVQPKHGVLVIQPDGTSLRYTPDEDLCRFVQTDSCSYTVADGQGGSDTASVTVEVSCVQFVFFGPARELDFDSSCGEASFSLPLFMQARSGPPEPVLEIVMDLHHDPCLLTPIQVVLGAGLESLNGGAGPLVSTLEIMNDGVFIQIVPGEALDASRPVEVAWVEYEVRPGALRGNPLVSSTQLQWAGGSFVETVDRQPHLETTDIALDFVPSPPPPGSINFFAPGQTVLYDAGTGDATFDQSIYIEEGPDGNADPIQAFSMGLAHDPKFLRALAMVPGADLSRVMNGEGPDYFGFTIFDEGVALGVVISFTLDESLRADGPREVVSITYETNPLGVNGTEVITPLTWTELGSPPVSNLVTIESVSTLPTTVSGSICLTP